MGKIIIMIAILVVAIGVAAFVYARFNDQGSSIIDKMESLLLGGTFSKRDSTLGQDAYQVGYTGTTLAATKDLTLPEIFKMVEKSVVQIKGTSDTSSRLQANSRLGSGFVYDTNRHIITNYHVAGGGRDLDVTFMDGNIYHAKLIGSDPFTDLAVLYVQDVPKDKLAPLPLGDSAKLSVGEQIAAIGNPFGLSGSMTAGIISGLGRIIPSGPSSGSQYSIPNIIQIDAPINPGNSGGPLLNMKGEVIGVNSAIFSTTGEFSGIGLAIPSNALNKVVPSLITKRSFNHPWLGLSGTNITPEIANVIGLKEPRGFLVVDVISGSPAEKAGIHGGEQLTSINGSQIPLGGDVIEKIDNKTIRKIDDVLVYLETEKSIGDNVKISVFREGQIQKINLILVARPSSQESP
ncbi:MAG TPA: trypsin-like peptidase domain-containing protein [Nitrososphaeraceae archaeon]|nr:trypsin-like peptidase domain-containing protein [Nitrososphaeraceae archaeon]